MFIDDSTGTLNAADKASIEAMANGRADVKIIVSSTGSRGELDASVGRLVNSANTLAIGIDPVHHYTFTHFGSGLGIASSDFQGIARSGNADFKAGHWAEGLRSIVGSATLATRTTAAQPTAVILQQPTTVIEHPVSPFPFVIGGAVLLVLALAIWAWMRRREREANDILETMRNEAENLRTRNEEEQGWHDKMAPKMAAARELAEATRARPVAPAAAPAPRPMASVPARSPRTIIRERVIQAPPVIVQQGGGGDLLTGYALGQMAAERREPAVVERRHRTPTPAPSSSSSSWDSGGSSSSWDSGSGGGGFDSGGGGFDGGSGGGDF